MMDFDQFKEKAFAAALAEGCDAAELYFLEENSFSATVLEQELDAYSVSQTRGLNLRVQLAGKNGYAYTESLDTPENLALRAMDNARAIENEDDHPMQGKCEYRTLPALECRIFVHLSGRKSSLRWRSSALPKHRIRALRA